MAWLQLAMGKLRWTRACMHARALLRGLPFDPSVGLGTALPHWCPVSTGNGKGSVNEVRAA